MTLRVCIFMLQRLRVGVYWAGGFSAGETLICLNTPSSTGVLSLLFSAAAKQTVACRSRHVYQYHAACSSAHPFLSLLRDTPAFRSFPVTSCWAYLGPKAIYVLMCTGHFEPGPDCVDLSAHNLPL